MFSDIDEKTKKVDNLDKRKRIFTIAESDPFDVIYRFFLTNF